MLMTWCWNILLNRYRITIMNRWHIIRIRIDHTNDTDPKIPLLRPAFTYQYIHTKVHFVEHNREKIQEMPKKQELNDVNKSVELSLLKEFIRIFCIKKVSYLSLEVFHKLFVFFYLCSWWYSILWKREHNNQQNIAEM
jgi:hypothetical protein